MGTTWHGGLGSGLLSSRRSGFTYSRDYTLRGAAARTERPNMSIKTARNQAIRAAKELQYDAEAIAKLYNATTQNELTRILLNARSKSCEEDLTYASEQYSAGRGVSRRREVSQG